MTIGEELTNESIIGTLHRQGHHETSVANYPAIIPTINGRAWITGTSQHMLAPDDPSPEDSTVSSPLVPHRTPHPERPTRAAALHGDQQRTMLPRAGEPDTGSTNAFAATAIFISTASSTHNAGTVHTPELGRPRIVRPSSPSTTQAPTSWRSTAEAPSGYSLTASAVNRELPPANATPTFLLDAQRHSHAVLSGENSSAFSGQVHEVTAAQQSPHRAGLTYGEMPGVSRPTKTIHLRQRRDTAFHGRSTLAPRRHRLRAPPSSGRTPPLGAGDDAPDSARRRALLFGTDADATPTRSPSDRSPRSSRNCCPAWIDSTPARPLAVPVLPTVSRSLKISSLRRQRNADDLLGCLFLARRRIGNH